MSEPKDYYPDVPQTTRDIVDQTFRDLHRIEAAVDAGTLQKEQALEQVNQLWQAMFAVTDTKGTPVEYTYGAGMRDLVDQLRMDFTTPVNPERDAEMQAIRDPTGQGSPSWGSEDFELPPASVTEEPPAAPDSPDEPTFSVPRSDGIVSLTVDAGDSTPTNDVLVEPGPVATPAPASPSPAPNDPTGSDSTMPGISELEPPLPPEDWESAARNSDGSASSPQPSWVSEPVLPPPEPNLIEFVIRPADDGVIKGITTTDMAGGRTVENLDIPPLHLTIPDVSALSLAPPASIVDAMGEGAIRIDGFAIHPGDPPAIRIEVSSEKSVSLVLPRGTPFVFANARQLTVWADVPDGSLVALTRDAAGGQLDGTPDAPAGIKLTIPVVPIKVTILVGLGLSSPLTPALPPTADLTNGWQLFVAPPVPADALESVVADWLAGKTTWLVPQELPRPGHAAFVLAELGATATDVWYAKTQTWFDREVESYGFIGAEAVVDPRGFVADLGQVGRAYVPADDNLPSGGTSVPVEPLPPPPVLPAPAPFTSVLHDAPSSAADGAPDAAQTEAAAATAGAGAAAAPSVRRRVPIVGIFAGLALVLAVGVVGALGLINGGPGSSSPPPASSAIGGSVASEAPHTSSGTPTSPPPISSQVPPPSFVIIATNEISFGQAAGFDPAKLCQNGGTVTFTWKIAGIAPNTPVVAQLTGPGTSSPVTFTATSDVPVTKSYSIPPGGGSWSDTITSIGGKAPPTSGSHTSTVVQC